MRVAFDEQIFAIQRHGGISRVFAELAREFTVNPEHGVDVQPVAAPIVNEYVLGDQRITEQLVVRPGRHWFPAIARSMARRRHRGPADVVHNTFYLPRALQDYPQARRVVTIHDMIPELFPHTRRRLDVLTRKHAYVRDADHIICISDSTKRDLLRIYPDVRVPISVVHHGVSAEFHPDHHPLTHLPTRYVLHVGHRSGYKDAATLFRAFARVARTDPALHLVLVGGGSMTSDEAALASRLGIGGRVVQRRLAEAEMPSAYTHAQLLAFPSRYEGFGLPALEAMACGTPAVLCAASSLPEVGGDAAVYFDPGDDLMLAELMGEVLEDSGRHAALVERGFARARGFTWSRSAQAVARAYRRALGQEG